MELFNEFENELIHAAQLVLADGVERLKTRKGLFLSNRTKRADRPTILAERKAVIDYLSATYGALRHEIIAVVLIDAQGRLISIQLLDEGKASSVRLNQRLLCEHIIKSGAAAIVLAHNHPSGDNTPSSQDIQLTKSLAQWLKIIDCELIDHLVLSCAGASAILGEF